MTAATPDRPAITHDTEPPMRTRWLKTRRAAALVPVLSPFAIAGWAFVKVAVYLWSAP